MEFGLLMEEKMVNLMVLILWRFLHSLGQVVSWLPQLHQVKYWSIFNGHGFLLLFHDTFFSWLEIFGLVICWPPRSNCLVAQQGSNAGDMMYVFIAYHFNTSAHKHLTEESPWNHCNDIPLIMTRCTWTNVWKDTHQWHIMYRWTEYQVFSHAFCVLCGQHPTKDGRTCMSVLMFAGIQPLVNQLILNTSFAR